MTIMPEKFRDPSYKGAQDWIKSFIDHQVKTAVMKTVKTKDEDGNVTEQEVESKKTQVDLNKLFDLAEKNSLNVEKYTSQMDQKNAPGRLRMTIGNMLRAAARKRHGLYDLAGDWHDAPADFIGDAELKENRDGSKIAEPASEDAQAEAA